MKFRGRPRRALLSRCVEIRSCKISVVDSEERTRRNQAFDIAAKNHERELAKLTPEQRAQLEQEVMEAMTILAAGAALRKRDSRRSN